MTNFKIMEIEVKDVMLLKDFAFAVMQAINIVIWIRFTLEMFLKRTQLPVKVFRRNLAIGIGFTINSSCELILRDFNLDWNLVGWMIAYYFIWWGMTRNARTIIFYRTFKKQHEK